MFELDRLLSSQASWFVGLPLLLFLVILLVLNRMPVAWSASPIVGLLAQLLAGFFAFVFVGDMGIHRMWLRAAVAVASFVVVMMLWSLDQSGLTGCAQTLKAKGFRPFSVGAEHLAKSVRREHASLLLFPFFMAPSTRVKVDCSCSIRTILLLVATIAALMGLLPVTRVQPTLFITRLLSPDPEGGDSEAYLAGGISGAPCTDLRVVLYVLRSQWIVQTRDGAQMIRVDENCRWSLRAQRGTAYAALLVRSTRGLSLQARTTVLPRHLSNVLASVEILDAER